MLRAIKKERFQGLRISRPAAETADAGRTDYTRRQKDDLVIETLECRLINEMLSGNEYSLPQVSQLFN